MKKQAKLDLCWHSTFTRPEGYAMVSRSLTLALAEAGVEVSYDYVYGPGTVFPVSEDKVFDDERLNAIDSRRPRRKTPHLVYGQADAFGYVKRGVINKKYKIGYTMLETTGVPEDWVSQSNEMDEIWTPSHFTAWTFRKSGVRKPICVMPLGVDTDHFHQGVKGYPLKDKYTFLSVFEWGERKAPELLLKAFNETFTKDEPVVLICKYNNYDDGVEVIEQIDELGLDPDAGQIVFIANTFLTYYQLSQLYRSADCFVFPTRGEGWGMPIMEAMACGLPVIATYWSAQQTYMTDENSYPLQVAGLVDAQAKCPYYKGFKWAEPDISHLKYLLRHAYENPEESRAKGDQAARDVKEKWSLGLCEKRMRERLTEISHERSEKRKPSFLKRLPEGQFKPKIGLDMSRSVGGNITEIGRSCIALLKGLAGLDEKMNPFEYMLLPGLGDYVNEAYLKSYSFNEVDDGRFSLYRGPLPAFSNPDYYVPGLDLVHSTTCLKPDTQDIPLVMTVRDLGFLTHPQFGKQQDAASCENAIMNAIDSDTHFIAVSENIKNNMVERLGVNPDHISIVYDAVDPGEFRRLPPEQYRGIPDKYGLPERFFLIAGGPEPLEKLKIIIEAIKLYNGPEQLLIAGQTTLEDTGLDDVIEGDERRIKQICDISREELPVLYNSAIATICPSPADGSGLPVLESMACGTPVIAFSNPSISEVVGNACVLLEDLTNPEELADAMNRVASNESLRERSLEEGLKQASKFSPDRAARSTVSVYAGLLGITL